MRYLPFFVGIGLSFAASANNYPYCEETATIYGLHEETPLGFSGTDLLELAPPLDLKITYGYKPECTTGSIVVSPRSQTARYITSSPVYPPCDDENGCPEIGIICENRVEVDATISLSSKDGAFFENWPTTLTSFVAGECLDQGTYAGVRRDIPSLELVGNFYDDSSIEVPVWNFSGLFTPAGFRGEIDSWITQCVDSTDSEGVCYHVKLPGANFER